MQGGGLFRQTPHGGLPFSQASKTRSFNGHHLLHLQRCFNQGGPVLKKVCNYECADTHTHTRRNESSHKINIRSPETLARRLSFFFDGNASWGASSFCCSVISSKFLFEGKASKKQKLHLIYDRYHYKCDRDMGYASVVQALAAPPSGCSSSSRRTFEN